MNTVKSTGFLRIWKVVLLMMAMVLFIVVGGVKTAWADDVFLMDDTGHAITRDQIADKTVEITFTTHGHSEGHDPNDHGEDHIVHTNIFIYPYTESFKKAC